MKMVGEKVAVRTDKAPAAVGPYEQAIRWQKLVFTAGQIPIDPVTGQLRLSNIQEQTRLVLENLKAVLEASGSSLENALKVTIYLKDLNQFSSMNAVFEEYFSQNKPARTTVEVSNLPLGVGIEIDAIGLVID
jgi:2-iminobutanoate/2-iminopropanoate deaminase